jgi:hypothetical protein
VSRPACRIASIAILMVGLAAQAAAADGMSLGDVRTFGAVGDGNADDTVAIQKAVDTVQQGTVYLPTGVYKITAPITLRPGLSLVGEPDPAAVGGSTLLAGADMEAMIRIPDFGHMLRIESLTLDGGADQGRSIGSCLNLQGFCASRVGNVRIRSPMTFAGAPSFDARGVHQHDGWGAVGRQRGTLEPGRDAVAGGRPRCAGLCHALA